MPAAVFQAQLPPRAALVRAYLERDSAYEGVFVTAVRTTGIFCRPTCPARKPHPDNVEFFDSCQAALIAGYRPCKRCRPLAPAGEAPEWLEPLLAAVERDPARRWRDSDVRGLGLEPARVARWFKANHGMTFHAYSRARRLGQALGAIQRGERVSSAAFGAGYDSLAGFNEAIQRFAGRAPSRLAEAAVVTVGRLETLLGPMIAGATAEHLVLLQFADRRMLSTLLARLARALGCVFAPGGSPLLAELAAQLGAYFRGERMVFDVPLLTPGSPFQEEVWRALCEIPPAATRSYGELARIVGRPGAIRAVARANGDNPISILIPCHRVVGADGRLVGYGGGLWRKQRLLTLEGGGARIEATGPLEHLAARISRQP